MKKINIKAGDVPETDEEVEKVIGQLERQEANKKARITAVRGKDSGKHARQEQLKAVVLDGNQEVVTDAKTKAAIVRREKKVALKVVKEKAQKPATNPKGHAWLSPELVTALFRDVDAGLSRQEAASKYNVSMSSVVTIMNPPEWFLDAMKKKGLKTYPTRTPKLVEKKSK